MAKEQWLAVNSRVPCNLRPDPVIFPSNDVNRVVRNISEPTKGPYCRLWYQEECWPSPKQLINIADPLQLEVDLQEKHCFFSEIVFLDFAKQVDDRSVPQTF